MIRSKIFLLTSTQFSSVGITLGAHSVHKLPIIFERVSITYANGTNSYDSTSFVHSFWKKSKRHPLDNSIFRNCQQGLHPSLHEALRTVFSPYM